MNDAINKLIKEAKEKGYRVLTPEKLSTYFWIFNGNNIGYCQYDNVYGVSYSTVHKANKYTGTGYKAASMEESVMNKPVWASNDGSTVYKYSGPAEFINKHWQKLVEI